MSYEDTNWKGLGRTASVGFGNRKKRSILDHLRGTVHGRGLLFWRVNLFRWEWEDIENYVGGESVFEYEETRTGISVGAGKKFPRDPRLSWYATLNWHDSDISEDSVNWFLFRTDKEKKELIDWMKKYDIAGKYIDRDATFDSEESRKLATERIKDKYFNEHMQSGKTFSVTGRLQRSTLDEYLSYPKGDVMSINVEQLWILGSDWNFTKYWFEARYYTPVTRIGGYSI